VNSTTQNQWRTSNVWNANWNPSNKSWRKTWAWLTLGKRTFCKRNRRHGRLSMSPSNLKGGPISWSGICGSRRILFGLCLWWQLWYWGGCLCDFWWMMGSFEEFQKFRCVISFCLHHFILREFDISKQNYCILFFQWNFKSTNNILVGDWIKNYFYFIENSLLSLSKSNILCTPAVAQFSKITRTSKHGKNCHKHRIAVFFNG